MVEIYRNMSPFRVAHYKTVIEQVGILCMMKNETIAMTEIPIPEFYPVLCVMEERDVERAKQVLKDYMASETEEVIGDDVACKSCGAKNPANFEVCWSCEGELKPA